MDAPFLQRHIATLAVRKREKARLSRVTSFNKASIDMFFDNLLVHKKFGPFPSSKIWNQDETGVTIVQNPPKIGALVGWCCNSS